MKFLAKCSFLKNLKSLLSYNNDIKDEGLLHFSECQFLINLISLELDSNNIGDEGIAILIPM